MKFFVGFAVHIIVLSAVSVLLLPADEKHPHHWSPPYPASQQPHSIMQGTNLRVWISDQLAMGNSVAPCQGGDQCYGCEYPIGSGVEHLWAMNFEIVTLMNDVPRCEHGYISRFEEFALESHFLSDTGWLVRDRDSLLTPIVSDRDLFATSTDTVPQSVLPQPVPLGLTIVQRSYAWHDPALDAIIPIEYSIVNISRSVMRNFYIGFFADMDVGPTTDSNYYMHNYAGFDHETHTAYVHNPVDVGATPLGISLLGTLPVIDTTKVIFNWWDYSHGPQIGSSDSALYAWLSQISSSGQPIAGNQSPDSLSDTRCALFVGPFDSLNTDDTIRISIALVSGIDIATMLANAQMADTLAEQDFVLGIHAPLRVSPATYSLSQNYPNPFNPVTAIGYSLSVPGLVTLKVFNVLGQEVATLVNERKQSGEYTVEWNASNQPSGVYFYRVQAGTFNQTRKLLLMR